MAPTLKFWGSNVAMRFQAFFLLISLMSASTLKGRMSKNKNWVAGNLDQGWIHELARGENQSEAQALLDRQSHSPSQWIEESTVDFLTDLRAEFQEFVRVFNSLSEAGKKYSEVKIFNLTQGAADFMLYRNGLKLIVANTSHGVIQISYDRHTLPGGTFNEVDQTPGSEEVLAQIGAFSTVHWVHRGERVESEEVSRHFFSEFVRMTREIRKGKGNQKVLLQQIKALLQEQGLELE